jgi:hypothetical protein
MYLKLNHHHNPNRQMKEVKIRITIKNFRSPIVMHQRFDLLHIKRVNLPHRRG